MATTFCVEFPTQPSRGPLPSEDLASGVACSLTRFSPDIVYINPRDSPLHTHSSSLCFSSPQLLSLVLADNLVILFAPIRTSEVQLR